MPREKEKSMLKPADYKINGNSIRAFYDKKGKLVFVLDLTVNKFKPNVLLVMTAHGDRKWDDVLANDYGMDLELIRPKKDNKYQKLDIDYNGLAVYDNLIRLYQDDKDVKKALKDLSDFRAMSVRRSAKERIEASTLIAENARETIERTGDTITELQAKIKAVRAKLTTLRRGIGKEPTKQSAAKILKAEAQLDVLKGKLERAKKRLENANKRLLVAEDDIAAARKVLDLVPAVDDDKKFKTVALASKSKNPEPQEEDVDDVDDEDDDYDDEDEETDDTSDDQDEEDSWTDEEDDEEESDDADEDDDDNDVKPLFDKDPNILDENIAFKPINFDETPVQTTPTETDEEEQDEYQEDTQEKTEMSFTPPKPVMDIVQVPNYEENSGDVKLDDVFTSNVSDDIKYEEEAPVENVDAPMLDSLKSVDVQQDDDVTEETVEETVDAPQSGVVEYDVPTEPQNAPAPTNTGYDSSTLMRPSAPGSAPVVTDVPRTENTQHRPNLLYYVLLLVLIALSVFTLWLYQRSNVSADAIPELVSNDTTVSVQKVEQPVQKPEQIAVPDEDLDDDNPFIATIDNDADTDVVPASQNVGAKAVIETILDTAVNAAVDTEPEPVIIDAKEEKSDDIDIMPILDDVASPAPQVDEESEPVVNKPEYQVSQEDVFVNTDSDVTSGNLCNGDVAPDAHGCCPGETYTYMGSAGFNCCPKDGGDCFPPMF